MLTSFKAAYDCVASWEVDLSEDLKKMDIPTLLLHGTDDQVVPIDASARTAIKLLPNGKLIEFPGGAHGIPNTEAEWVNKHLIQWLKA
jgi:non-heme chloroperoxidase